MSAKKPQKPRAHARKKKKRWGCLWSLLLLLGGLVLLLLAALAYLALREKRPPKPAVVEQPKTQPTPVRTAAPKPRLTPSPAPQGNLPSDFEPVSAERKGGVIALVLDDLGHSPAALSRLEPFSEPMAVAVLPDGRLARESAEFGRRKGWDVLLHLPMESKNGSAEESTIRVKQKDSEIRAAVSSMIDKVPGLIGVSNHQGSVGTSDRRVMAAVLSVVKGRHLFFLDSRTTNQSVAVEEARRLGVSVRARDVFLDDPDAGRDAGGKAEGLAQAWEKAMKIVQERGDCIVIGHPSPETTAFLSAEVPKAKKGGIRFVRVSELVD